MSEECSDHRHMTEKETANHLAMHFQRAIEELVADNIVLDVRGLSRYAESVVLGDVIRRSHAADLPWDVVLSAMFIKISQAGLELEKQGILDESIGDSEFDL